MVVQKTRELCQTIVDQPEFQDIRKRIDTFMADEAAKTQYQSVMEKGEMLQHKQQMGLPMSAEEIKDFENNRDALVNNPVARDFIDAQQAMQKNAGVGRPARRQNFRTRPRPARRGFRRLLWLRLRLPLRSKVFQPSAAAAGLLAARRRPVALPSCMACPGYPLIHPR